MMALVWNHARAMVIAASLSSLLACNPGSVPSSSTDGPDTTSGTTDPSASSTPTPPPDSSGDSTATADTEAPSTTSSSGTLDDTGTTGTECDPEAIVRCGGSQWICSNGLDDDGDGRIDLDDPECISPCDESEHTFPQSIPGDSSNCRADCGFDGNRGAGDDSCLSNPICDPLTPEGGYCGYDPSNPICSGEIPSVPPECQAFCEQFVPNGCDCFGCCTFLTDAGPVDRLISGDGIFSQPLYLDCALDQLDACPPCTQHMDLCGNPCEVDQCEICIGQTEPPEGCESATCVGGTACTDHCDCEPGEYCFTGCCTPDPE